MGRIAMTDASTRALHDDAIVVDAHSDVFCDVTRRRLLGETEVLTRLHVPAWRAAGVDVVVTTLYTEEEHKPDRALRRAITLMGAALADIDETPDVALCRTRAEIDATLAAGKIAFVLAMEGGEPVQDGIARCGCSTSSACASSGSPGTNATCWRGDRRGTRGGRTDRAGREMVAEANRLGILLDASHLSVKSFWDLIETSSRPVIASHSNATALCAHPRNIDDDQIRAIVASGGAVGVNAVAKFIADDPAEASLDRMLDHLDHIVSVAGVENVALGPDFVDYLRTGPHAPFDDAPGIAPTGFATITDLPNVTAGLLARGYDEAAVRGILGGNMLRLLDTVMGG